MNLQHVLTNIKNKQDGAVALIVAFAMVVILGSAALVVDLGIRHNTASRLQNSLDSSVLAAAQELPATDTQSVAWLSATAIGLQYAKENGFNDVTISEISKGGRIVGVRAVGNTAIDYTFARVFGIEKGNIQRVAAAELEPVSGMKGLVPLTALEAEMNGIDVGDIRILKVGKDNYKEYPENGWFGALTFGTPGASQFESNLVNGFNSEIKVGDIVNTENGNMAGPTIDSFMDRIYKPGVYDHRACTFESHEEDCKRIITVPIVDAFDESGHTKVEVLGFASFFIESVTLDATNKASISAKYFETIHSDSSSSGTPGDYGVYTIKLTQ